MNQGKPKYYQLTKRLLKIASITGKKKMVPELVAAQPRTISSGRIEKHAHQSINRSEKQAIHSQKNKTVL